jgi:hypothetical protein
MANSHLSNLDGLCLTKMFLVGYWASPKLLLYAAEFSLEKQIGWNATFLLDYLQLSE